MTTHPIMLAVPDVDTHVDHARRRSLANMLGLTPPARWGILEVVDCMGAVATQGDGLVLKYHAGRDHWGKGNADIVLPKNPTWLQIAHAAADAIRISGDEVHVCIEGITRKRSAIMLYVSRIHARLTHDAFAGTITPRNQGATVPKAKVEVSSVLLAAIHTVWQDIGSDSLQCAAECGERLTNEGAIEGCIDANRLTSNGRSPEAEAELASLLATHGYPAVMRKLKSELQLA